MIEIWKPITGYEGKYEISNKGRVKSLSRITRTYLKGGIKVSRELIMSNRTNDDRYESVELMKEGYGKYHSVHRLVAIHFIENTLNKPEVNHIDTIRTNNLVTNLEWSTHSENISHSVKLGNYNTENMKEARRVTGLIKTFKAKIKENMKYGQTQGDIKHLGSASYGTKGHLQIDVICMRCGKKSHIRKSNSLRCNSCTQKVRNRKNKFLNR